jgi:hypothetical protein
MWKLIDCAVQGRGHRKNDPPIPCQDKTKVLSRNDVSVITLADGAGSAKLSHFGAECVVETISAYLADNFQAIFNEPDGKNVKLEIMDLITGKLTAKSLELNCEISDLACTLLAVACKDDRYILAHIGDGVIGYLDGSVLKVASAPDNGEFSNVTTFVTSKEALSSMRLIKGEKKSISGFVIMSDGAEQSFYHKQTKSLAIAVKKLMQRNVIINSDMMLSRLNEAFESVVIMNTLDDCSLALMSRITDSLCLYEDFGFTEKCEFFGMLPSHHDSKKRIERIDTILLNLKNQPLSESKVATLLHLKQKHAKKYLTILTESGLVIKNDFLYVSAIR